MMIYIDIGKIGLQIKGYKVDNGSPERFVIEKIWQMKGNLKDLIDEVKQHADWDEVIIDKILNYLEEHDY